MGEPDATRVDHRAVRGVADGASCADLAGDP